MSSPSKTVKSDSGGASTGQVLANGQGVESPSAASELSTMIDSLLNDLTSKFTAVANELTAKMDDMSRRIDNLEQSLVAQDEQGTKSEPDSEAGPSTGEL